MEKIHANFQFGDIFCTGAVVLQRGIGKKNTGVYKIGEIQPCERYAVQDFSVCGTTSQQQ